MALRDNPGMCFGCGTANPMGLRLELSWGDNECSARLHVRPELTGWRGYMHGGVLAAALDEMMGKIVWKNALLAMTGRMIVRYRQPVPEGADLHLRGRIDKLGSRIIRTAAEARLPDGTLVADAEALYVRVAPGETPPPLGDELTGDQ